MKSRHSSTKISVTLVHGKASGRVATSRFVAGSFFFAASVTYAYT
ncbi:hypothetical protein ACFSQ5_09480 [Enterococcus gallinarum]